MSKEDEYQTLDYEKIRVQILEQLENSNPIKAYSIIRSILDYPGQIEDDIMWRDAFDLFERIARLLIGDELGDLVEKVIETPNDVQALYDLSYELYEQSVHGIAATILKRASKIDPQDEKIVSELVSNLEYLMLNEEASIILTESKDLLETSELCKYLLAFNRLMTGNIELPTIILPRLKDSSDKNIQFMAESLEGMLERISVLKTVRKLDHNDLRGWHMALNGSILLHLSPYALDDAMHGRYAYISDSYSLCRHGIERLKEVLKVAEINMPLIISLPNRSSRILATATSEIMGKPLRIWNEADFERKGLLVAYNLAEFEPGEFHVHMATHRPGQILWAHASCWTDPIVYTPDITTFLYQQSAAPWAGGQLAYDTKAKEVTKTEPDGSNEEEIAQRIVDADADEDYLDDLEDLLSMIKPLKNLSDQSKPGIFKNKGRRCRQRLGSPVPSNRFM